uniref:Uncharacterized protein n=1 Tax=Loa loa TaxID=7209 RepID=A0A1I7VEN0_LOALO
MARLSAKGESEREAMLKKREKDREVGTEEKFRKNGSNDEREMQQQIPTSEKKAEKRANAKKKTPSTAVVSANGAAAVDVSAELSHDSHIEHENNGRERKNFMRSIMEFIYHDGYVCNRTISAWSTS